MSGFFYFWNMINESKEKLCYKSKRPFWHFVLAAPIYFVLIVMFFKTISLFNDKEIMNGLKFSTAVFFMFVCAAGLTFTKRVFTDSKLKMVRFQFTLFGIRLCRDVIIKDIQYIAVYKNLRDRDYEVNIWLSEKQKKTVSMHVDKKKALLLAGKISEGLEVDLLDATEKGNFVWIEKNPNK